MFDEIQREGIRVEAQAILKRFSDKIASVKVTTEKSTSGLSGMRHNEVVKTAEGDFRDLMFKNAKTKDSDLIYAEKKKW